MKKQYIIARYFKGCHVETMCEPTTKNGSIRWMNDEFVDGDGNHINRRNMLDILISPKFREGWKII